MGVNPAQTRQSECGLKNTQTPILRNVFIYSLTVKPEEDTPEKLKEYAEMHNVGPGWQFLTGKPADVELLRSKLGFVDLNPQVDQNDRASHSGMIRFGNEPQAWWAACQGQTNPEWIVREISFVIPRERGVAG